MPTNSGSAEAAGAVAGLLPSRHRPAIPGGPQTVARVLDRGVALHPDREALVGRTGRFTYAALDRAAASAASALRELGVVPGDRVAACLHNDVDIVVAFLGVMRAGAVWVGVNAVLAPPEKRTLLADCGARAFLGAGSVVSEVADLAAGLPDLAKLVEISPGHADCAWAVRCRRARVWDDAPPIDPFAPAAIAYTSGTTGHPKGAVHSQHNLLLPGAVSRATGQYDPEIRLGVVLPLTILNLVVLGPLVAFQYGTACIAMDRVDATGIAAWVRDERVGTFAGVPTILHDLLTHPDVRRDDLASLIAPAVGGAECPEEFRALYRERFGSDVRIGYGMTEAPTAVTWSDGDAGTRPGLCGRPLPQVEIQIHTREGERLPVDEVGEICVAPATSGDWAGVYTPMLGYWGRPDATAEALRGGAYHTGDLGFLDEDGTLYIRGRQSELILRGGANVYPAEVERVLGEHPGVAACAVLGIPDPRLGERVVAAVELEPASDVTPEELGVHCRAALARYKSPERIVVVSSLPRNAMSKVVKHELRCLFETP